MTGSAYDFVITGKDQSSQAWASLAKSAKEAEGLLQKLSDPVQELQSVAAKAEDIFKGFLGFEAIRRFTEFHKSVQESVGALKSQADAVGYTTDALQAYQAAFRAANLPIETGQAAIANLNVAIGRAAMGEKEAAEAFQTLGVRILDQNGKVRENTAILTEASRALLAVEDTATRAALAKVLFSKAGAQLTPVLRETARGLTDLDAAARDAGQTLSRETIEIFDRLKNQSEETSIRIRNFYAELAAPVQLAGVDAINRGIANLSANIKAAAKDWTNLVGLLSNPFGTIGALAATTSTKDLQDQIDARRKEVAGLQRSLDAGDLGQRGQAAQRKRIADTTAALDELLRKQAQLEAANGGLAGRSAGLQDNPFDLNLPNASNKFAVAKPTGAGRRDRIGEEMQQLTGNVEAARTAYEQLRAAAATAVSTEDLQRQVDLQKRISDELARIGKYAKDDPRVPQIKALVTEHEQYEFQVKQLEAALKTADVTQKAFGDGTAEFARRQFDLNQALATGRLSQEAYNAAMIEANLIQQEQIQKARQYVEGLAGMAAGFEYARLQQQRQNTAFNQGVELYNASRQAFGSFFSTFNQDLRQGKSLWESFGDAATKALEQISDKLMQMAADQLWNAAFGGSGGGGGGILNLLGLGGGGSTPSIGPIDTGGAGGGFDFGSMLSGIGGLYADGGDPPVGVPSIVGENGPEWFVPKQAGTVYNRQQMAAMAGAGGERHEVVVTLDSDYLHAQVNRQIDGATPRIVNVAVRKASDLAPAAVAQDHQMRTPDWRLNSG